MPIYEFKCRKCGETFDVLFGAEMKNSPSPARNAIRPDAAADVRIRRKDREHERRGASCGSCAATSCSPT